MKPIGPAAKRPVPASTRADDDAARPALAGESNAALLANAAAPASGPVTLGTNALLMVERHRTPEPPAARVPPLPGRVASLEEGWGLKASGEAPSPEDGSVDFLANARERLAKAPEYFASGEPSKRTLDGRTVFGDPVFWKALPADVAKVRCALKAWYPHLWRNPAPLAALENIDPRCIALLLDPGVACRLEEFTAFAKAWLPKNEGASLYRLRQAFAESLGNVELYRAIAVPDADAKRLASLSGKARAREAHALGYADAPSLRPQNRDESAKVIGELMSGLQGGPGKLLSPAELIGRHTTWGTKASLLASYSAYPEIAKLAASAEMPPGQTLILMKARMPAISVVRTTGLLAGLGISALGHRELKIPGGGAPLWADDPGIEVFSFLRSPAHITDVVVATGA